MINSPRLNCVVLYSLFTVLLVACDAKDRGDIAKAGVIDADGLATKQILVPAGKFIRGSNKEDDPDMRQRYGFPAPLYLDEHPERRIYLDAFKIDTYEVTNRQYKAYLLKTRTMLPYLWMSNGYTITRDQLNTLEKEKLQKLALDVFMLDIDTRAMDKSSIINAIIKKQSSQDDLPVSGINWFAAKSYCEWRKGRLPREAEWEKAARGPDGLEYPWGNKWDPGMTNTGDDGKWDEGMAPGGSYKNNQSPYGVYDMAGNAWEWVEDWYLPYEGSSYTTDAFGQKNKVLRGGGGGVGHYAISYFFRAATRQFSEPEMESEDVGFRCVTDL